MILQTHPFSPFLSSFNFAPMGLNQYFGKLHWITRDGEKFGVSWKNSRNLRIENLFYKLVQFLPFWDIWTLHFTQNTALNGYRESSCSDAQRVRVQIRVTLILLYETHGKVLLKEHVTEWPSDNTNLPLDWRFEFLSR